MSFSREDALYWVLTSILMDALILAAALFGRPMPFPVYVAEESHAAALPERERRQSARSGFLGKERDARSRSRTPERGPFHSQTRVE